jgi:hypothetical protein
LRPKGVGEQCAGADQQIGDPAVGELVEHGVADPLCPDDAVPLEDGKMLGQHRGFHLGLGEDGADCGGLLGGREDLQHPDPCRVGQRLEEVGLDLVEGAFAAAGEGIVWHGHPD